jgi:hypothetical protein
MGCGGRLFKIRARVRDDTAPRQEVPAATWAGITVRDWLRGQAETEAGVLLYDIQVCSVESKDTSNNAMPLQMGSGQIDNSTPSVGVPAEDSKNLHGSGAQSASSRAKRRTGRPPKLDWSAVEVEVFQLMDHHGEFSPNDREWNAQAKLEAAVQDLCKLKLHTDISVSRIKEKLPEMLQRWRDKKSKT